MWIVLVFHLVLIWFEITTAEEAKSPLPGAQAAADVELPGIDKFGANLVTALRNDVNLDLSVDEEYEDLRAELLAYHTTLAKLSEVSARRSMLSTPCWKLGGICVNRKLCSGYRSLTEVPGCKDKLNVCCFNWNQFKIKTIKELNVGGRYPWSNKNIPYGGSGIVFNGEKPKDKQKKIKAIQENSESISDTKELIVSNAESALREKKSKSLDGHENIDDNDSQTDGEVERPLKKGQNTETIALILRGA